MGGWARLEGEDFGLPGLVYARFADVDGRLRITELYYDGRGEPIQAGALRRFPLGPVEDWLSIDEEDWIRAGLPHVSPDLSRLASHFHGRSGRMNGVAGYRGRTCANCGAFLERDERYAEQHRQVLGSEYRERAITDWVHLSLLAQYDREFFESRGWPIVPQSPRGREGETEVGSEPITLADPEAGLTDAFLQDVARAYRAAVGQGRRDPAVAISELPSVTYGVRTVHSWIYKARKRGYLPPARRDGKE